MRYTFIHKRGLWSCITSCNSIALNETVASSKLTALVALLFQKFRSACE